jgi:hypothetical protein
MEDDCPFVLLFLLIHTLGEIANMGSEPSEVMAREAGSHA